MKRTFTIVAIALSIAYTGTTGCVKGTDDITDPTNVAKVIPDITNFAMSAARTFVAGEAALISLASSTLLDGVYTVNYSLSGSNTYTGTASFTMSGGYGSFNTTELANGGNTTVIINTIISPSGGSINVTTNNSSSFFDSTGTFTGDLQFIDPFYATDVTASLTGSMLVIDATMWDPLRTMDISVKNFNTANLPHTYNFTDISVATIGYIGNGIKTASHGSVTIQSIVSGVLSGSYTGTMGDSSTVSGTFKAKYD